MKIRRGFVSNSSSSSFILGCDNPPLDRVQTVELLKKDPESNILVVGSEMSDGNDIFYLTEREVDFILNHEERFCKGFTEWKAYLNPTMFEPDPRESWDYEGPEDTKDLLKDNEQIVYKDYSSESEEDFTFFATHYFLTGDEYSAYWDWYRNGDPDRCYRGAIVYTEKTQDPNIPEDWTNVYIGINEFAGYEGVGIFSCKKLTDGDLRRLRAGKVALKDGVWFYRDFSAVNERKQTMHLEAGDYNIEVMRSFFDKIRSLKYFLKEGFDED